MKVGEEKIYDLSVPDTHNYVANGIIVHNCWIWEYNEANKESGIITIVPIKSRNQDPSPFDLAVDFSIMRAGDATEADFNKADKETRSKPGTASTKAKESRERIGNLARDMEDYDLSDDDD